MKPILFILFVPFFELGGTSNISPLQNGVWFTQNTGPTHHYIKKTVKRCVDESSYVVSISTCNMVRWDSPNGSLRVTDGGVVVWVADEADIERRKKEDAYCEAERNKPTPPCKKWQDVEEQEEDKDITDRWSDVAWGYSDNQWSGSTHLRAVLFHSKDALNRYLANTEVSDKSFLLNVKTGKTSKVIQERKMKEEVEKKTVFDHYESKIQAWDLVPAD